MNKAFTFAACTGLAIATNHAFAFTDTTLIEGEWKTKCRYFNFHSEMLRCTAYIESDEAYFSIEKNGDKLHLFYKDNESKGGDLAWIADIATLAMKVDNGELMDLEEKRSSSDFDNHLALTLDENSDTSKNMIEDFHRGNFFRFKTEVEHRLYSDIYIEIPLKGFDEVWQTIKEKTES